MSNNDPMTPLCGAKARSNDGHPCRRFAGPNGRCSNHGGHSTGPKTAKGRKCQTRSVLKHGFYSQEMRAERAIVRVLIKRSKNSL
jgi:hypothetical protein